MGIQTSSLSTVSPEGEKVGSVQIITSYAKPYVATVSRSFFSSKLYEYSRQKVYLNRIERR